MADMASNKDLIAPTVHLNGTSKQGLMDGLDKAYVAIHAAMEALAMSAPNGRDYYVQDGDALAPALEQHFDRMGRLKSVYDELADLMTLIDEQ